MTSSPVAASSTGLDRFGVGGDRFVSLPARAAGGFDLKKKYLGRNARVACLHRTTRVDPHVASVARRSTGPSRAVDSRDNRTGGAGSAAARRDADRARAPAATGGVETVDAPGQSARVLGSASRIRAGAAEGSGVRASSEKDGGRVGRILTDCRSNRTDPWLRVRREAGCARSADVDLCVLANRLSRGKLSRHEANLNAGANPYYTARETFRVVNFI